MMAAGFLSLLLVFMLALSTRDESHASQQREGLVRIDLDIEQPPGGNSNGTPTRPGQQSANTNAPGPAAVDDEPVPVYAEEDTDN